MQRFARLLRDVMPAPVDETPAENEAAIQRLASELRSQFPVPPAIDAVTSQREADMGDVYGFSDDDGIPVLRCMRCKDICDASDFPSVSSMLCNECVSELRSDVALRLSA